MIVISIIAAPAWNCSEPSWIAINCSSVTPLNCCLINCSISLRCGWVIFADSDPISFSCYSQLSCFSFLLSLRHPSLPPTSVFASTYWLFILSLLGSRLSVMVFPSTYWFRPSVCFVDVQVSFYTRGSHPYKVCSWFRASLYNATLPWSKSN
jgi:hypothetical protein